MDDKVWRPSRPQWTDPHGVLWKRQDRWLGERDARRFVLRKSGSVAVERSGSHELTWLTLENRREYWDTNAAGHIDDRGHPVCPNVHGVTYHVSTWKSDSGERLVLLSEMC